MTTFEHPVFKPDEAGDSSLAPANGVSSLVCVRDNDVIVASGRVVRYAPDVGGNPSRLGKHTTLTLTTVEFDITSILLNDAGSALAIVGDRSVVVCFLPLAGTRPTSKTRNHLIGSELDLDANVSILKAIWNPVARHDSNLVVLTSDNYVRAYDVLRNAGTPENSLSLQSDKPGPEFSVSYDTIEDPVSIALGTRADPTGLFTLFVLTKGGDIFALCPWLPSQVSITKAHATDLLTSSVEAYFEARQQKNCTKEMRRHYRDQMSWATEIRNQLPQSIVETRLMASGELTDFYIVQRPQRKLSLYPQGPLLCQPFPDQLYEGDAVDLLTVDAGPMSALAVLQSTQRVSFFLQSSSIDVKWKSVESDASLEPPALALIDSVELPGSRGASLRLLRPSPLQTELTVYAASDHAVHGIDLSPWVDEISAAADDNDFDLSALSSFASKTWLTQLPAKFHGLGSILDSDGNARLFIVTADGVLASGVADEKTVASEPVGKGEAPASAKLESLLKNRSFEADVFTLVDGVRLQPPNLKGSRDNSTIQPTIESLEKLSNISIFYSEQATQVYKAGLLMHKRVGLQKAEQRRQQELVNSLDRMVANCQDQDLAATIKNVTQRQLKLQQRASELQEKLSKRKPLPISDQEKKWSSELKRVHHQVYDANGLDRRTKIATLQAELIAQELKVSGDSLSTSVAGYGRPSEKMRRLQALISKESGLISSTHQKLELLMGGLESQFGGLQLDDDLA